MPKIRLSIAKNKSQLYKVPDRTIPRLIKVNLANVKPFYKFLTFIASNSRLPLKEMPKAMGVFVNNEGAHQNK